MNITIEQAIKTRFIGQVIRFKNIPKGDQDYINHIDLAVENLDIETVDIADGPLDNYNYAIRIDFYCRRISDKEIINVYNIALDFEIEFTGQIYTG